MPYSGMTSTGISGHSETIEIKEDHQQLVQD